jgi:hypothetical protein
VPQRPVKSSKLSLLRSLANQREETLNLPTPEYSKALKGGAYTGLSKNSYYY